MDYEIETIDGAQYVTVFFEVGASTFPVDNSNPDFVAFAEAHPELSWS